jgi:hypothetical protein
VRKFLASLSFFAAAAAWVPVTQAQPVPLKIQFVQRTYATEWTENGQTFRKEFWVKGFKLFRYSSIATPWSLVTTVERVIETEQPTDTMIEISDTTIQPGLTYCYMARAYNDAGESPDSNTDCATIPMTPKGPHDVKAIILEIQ